MSITALSSEPAAIIAGDTISWLIALPDYPANGGWTLKYKAVCAAGYFAITAAASGADHAVAVAKAVTATYVPGTYILTKYVEHTDGSRVTIVNLSIIVNPDLAGKTSPYDNRSHVKKVLDAIEAVIEGRASRSDLEYEINTGSSSRRIKSMTFAELLKLRSQYKTFYQQELAAAGVAGAVGGGRIRTRL